MEPVQIRIPIDRDKKKDRNKNIAHQRPRSVTEGKHMSEIINTGV